MANANYVKFLRGTPSAYAALETKDNDTLYFIIATGASYGKLYFYSLFGNNESIIPYIAAAIRLDIIDM